MQEVYYLTRSQPPFFCLLVNLIYQQEGISSILSYLPAIEQEYYFWMKTSRGVNYQGVAFNRYWDEEINPRAESFVEDLNLAVNISNKEKFYRNIRAACESGWDFSSRWFEDPTDFSSIFTTDLLPVDLNSILYFIEQQLSIWLLEINHPEKSKVYANKAKNRLASFSSLFWNEKNEYFFDFNFNTNSQTKVWSLAGIYPLFF